MTQKSLIDLSVIIPIFNEEDTVSILYHELIRTLDKLETKFEIIFINDGSRDRSIRELEKIAKMDNRVVVIDFLRNFGQTAALSAGINQSRGEVIIPMDGDLQNDPKDIPKLLKKINEGYSVVSGWRKNRRDSFIRVWPSMIANMIIAKATGVKIHDNGCSLKAYRRDVIEGIHLYGEMHRFISVYATWSGGKVTEVVVNHRSREHGKSKYGMSRIFKVILDLYVIRFLYSYISRPIHFFGKYGFYVLAAGLFLESIAIILKIFYNRTFVSTPLPNMGAIFCVVGIQLILTGILAELMMRTYYESQDTKPYFIKKTINEKK